MSKKYLTSLDLNANEIQNARLQSLASAPGSPGVGRIYFDTTNNAAYIYNGSAWVALDASKLSGTIPNVALTTNPLARANHTGTQTASTISDFDTQVRLSRLDQLAVPTTTVSMNSQVVSNVAAPVNPNDAANKQYVDDKLAGLSWKDEVVVATTANLTLSGTQTIDGVAVVAGDRVLVKDQTTNTQNGIYTVAAGAWSRATDADAAAELSGMAVFVKSGTANGGNRYVSSNTGVITPGSSPITFVLFGAGGTYTAGNGISVGGNAITVVAAAGGGLSVAAGGVSVDTAVVARKFSASIGNNSLTSIPVTHSLGTQDVVVVVREVSTNTQVECDVVNTDTNNVTLAFAVAPTTNQYRVTVIG